ncbi:nitroreductase family deazaflavin-dependent oxidoreductase [Microcella humidisoli]|uniref:Nitroreductase family deazaflavin-dependent oxidoreductase n=1 Tax=Microcella humidisoli TaxID=2963406 RepID=A0ABY5FTH7_9MICO|nr:nitroreductase family deazaflavin-dependent oxidoreductase [Microcella humidisoli]UTT61591.1 nitroreductase family deazaflavin-dependent oxidoreductase [Microcella humidisoli]
MPMPRWWARMNKWTFNPRELAKGERPVIIHVGRRSGREYQTPLDAHAVDGGYLFVPVYGVNSDWVRNVLAAGSARLRTGGTEVVVTKPRLIDEATAFALLPEGTQRPPKWLKLEQYLLTDLAASAH